MVMYNNVFLSILPSLDLHGNTSDMIEVLIDDFFKLNLKLGKYKLLIVHGKGEGILRRKCHELLRHDKRVKNYYIDSFNDGCTVVELCD